MTVLSLDGRAVAQADFAALADLPARGPLAVDLTASDDPRALADLLARVSVVRIAFAGFADGRGFSLARRLRDLGYRGRLRAAGPLIPDQRGMLTACGFDEVDLPDAHLARCGGAALWVGATAIAPFHRRTPRERAA